MTTKGATARPYVRLLDDPRLDAAEGRALLELDRARVSRARRGPTVRLLDDPSLSSAAGSTLLRADRARDAYEGIGNRARGDSVLECAYEGAFGILAFPFELFERLAGDKK